MNLTPIQSILPSSAFNLFRAWTANAQKQFPNYDFTIVDESLLVADLTDSLCGALESLRKEKHREKRQRPGWDFGFVLGFIQGNLNAHWVNEYIRKRSDEYKMILVLQSLQALLKSEDILCIKAYQAYLEKLRQDTNLKTLDPRIHAGEADFKNWVCQPTDSQVNKTEVVHHSLDRVITERILAYAGQDSLNFMPDLQDYLSRAEITQLILNPKPTVKNIYKH